MRILKSLLRNQKFIGQLIKFWDLISSAAFSVYSHCLKSNHIFSMVRKCRLPNREVCFSLSYSFSGLMALILEKSDYYTMISGKISFYFNLSFEIKDKTIEFDENRNVQRAEFVVRAYMQGGRFSDGWGSCERREKKFLKPNHDIPSTVETRAKNKACQDLLGIGEYRSGAGQVER
ncbi:hypothetical protein UlMin_045767 [Ulmus minor]